MDRRAAFCLGSLALGCFGEAPPNGDLGQGDFSYECVDPKVDWACTNGAYPTVTSLAVPDRIAVDSRFRVDFAPVATEDAVRVEAPISDYVAAVGSTLRAKRAGAAALHAVRVTNGDLIDFTHVVLADVEKIELVNEQWNVAPDPSLPRGWYVDLQAAPMDRKGHYLAGTLTWTWKSSDDAVVSVSPGTSAALAHVTAKSAGKAIVTVSAGKAKYDFAFTVK